MDDKKMKNSQNMLPKGYKFYWLYMLFLIFIISSMFFGSVLNTKEISWLTFEQTMLTTHDVAKIIIVNKEVAEIYIKQEKLNSPKYKELPKG